MNPARLAVLISGAGRTLANILARIRDGSLYAEIALVIASADNAGAARARAAGLHVVVLPGRISLDAFTSLLREHAIDLVVLAGYLHLLPVPPAYEGRILNIHPALLPDFGGSGMFGRRVHEAVLAAGRTVSGCTVHLVSNQYDKGRILAQSTCPVLPGDTPESLAARVFERECDLYPRVIADVLTGKDRSIAIGNRPAPASE